MNNKTVIRIVLFILCLAGTGAYHCLCKESEVNVWKMKENLAFRLGSELYKMSLLNRELDAQSDILAEIRDLELFPSHLTGFEEKELVLFDKKIEIYEKETESLRQKLQLLNGPLSDAIAILRELVVGEPVESMFDVLEKGDLKRIDEMLAIKHDIESLWKKSDTLFNYVYVNSGLPLPNDNMNSVADDEFFQILKANLGQTSQDYYKRLNLVKNTMLQRANTDEINEMYKIERHRINLYIGKKDPLFIASKINDMIQRFEGKHSCDELYLLLARTQLQNSDFQAVQKTLTLITAADSSSQNIFLYKIQSQYGLQQYETILEETRNVGIAKYPDEIRNVLIWIIIECVLATKNTEYSVTPLLQYVSKSSSHSLNVIHAFARYLLSKNDTTTALSALESTSSYAITSEEDEHVRQRIDLIIADLYYESGNYDAALTQYYKLLKSEVLFAQALFGIVWCYIQTGESVKADVALKKLINQVPESSLAAEAILLLAKRYFQKARSSWKKLTYLESEQMRLKGMLSKILKQSEIDTVSSRKQMYTMAENELNGLLKRISDEPCDSYTQISDYYSQVQKICDLVNFYYKSGTFQQSTFSQQRESLLFYLDSVMLQVKNNSTNGIGQRVVLTAINDRIKIKKIVDDAAIFSASAQIEKYRWEREFIDNKKSQISKIIQLNEAKLKVTNDSIKINEITLYNDSLEKLMTLALRREAEIHETYFDNLTKQLTNLIHAEIAYDDYAYFCYHLGEIYYTHENSIYANQYDFYELVYEDFQKKLKAFRDGLLLELPLEPTPPVLNHDTSISYFKMITGSRNPSEYTHAAMYSLAWCYNDLSVFDSSLYYMEKLAANYPSSCYAPQAWMYAGEYYFDKNNLDKAISCYHSVMKYPESEWFDEALYKQAWAQYRLSNPEKAISSFLALVDLGGSKNSGKTLLEKESMDYIAISFSETDPTGPNGLERALAFAKKLGDVDRGCKILQRLASVYKEQGRFDMARKTLDTLLSTYPYYSDNPIVEYDRIALMERDDSPQDVNKKKIEYFKHYSKYSSWSVSQKDSLVVKVADSLSERQLYSAAIGFHQLALQKNEASYYKQALDAYRDYIRAYPLSSSANECHYNLAEIQFSIGNYKEAAEEYMAVSKRYPDSKYKETAAWNAIVASQNWLKQEQNKTR